MIVGHLCKGGDNILILFETWGEISEPMEGAGKTIPWTPAAGKYSLAIADQDEKILDYVYFEVRGPEADRNLLSEDGEGTFSN